MNKLENQDNLYKPFCIIQINPTEQKCTVKSSELRELHFSMFYKAWIFYN